jgi:hypothetical protein
VLRGGQTAAKPEEFLMRLSLFAMLGSLMVALATPGLGGQVLVTIGEASLDTTELTLLADEAQGRAMREGYNAPREDWEAEVLLVWARGELLKFLEEHVTIPEEEVEAAVADGLARGTLHPWNREWSQFYRDVVDPAIIRLGSQEPLPTESAIDAEYDRVVAMAPPPAGGYGIAERRGWHLLVAMQRAGTYRSLQVPQSHEEMREANRRAAVGDLRLQKLGGQLVDLSGAMESQRLRDVMQTTHRTRGANFDEDRILRSALVKRELERWTYRWYRDHVDVKTPKLRAGWEKLLREREAKTNDVVNYLRPGYDPDGPAIQPISRSVTILPDSATAFPLPTP